jgi:hypothetical protein
VNVDDTLINPVGSAISTAGWYPAALSAAASAAKAALPLALRAETLPSLLLVAVVEVVVVLPLASTFIACAGCPEPVECTFILSKYQTDPITKRMMTTNQTLFVVLMIIFYFIL